MPAMVKPARVMDSRNCLVLSRICLMNLSDAMSRSSTLMADPTTAGGRVFEKRYGRDRWRSKSINSFGPVVYPPAAPPNALPNVELMMSTRPLTLWNSSVPLDAKETKFFRKCYFKVHHAIRTVRSSQRTQWRDIRP